MESLAPSNSGLALLAKSSSPVHYTTFTRLKEQGLPAISWKDKMKKTIDKKEK